MAIPYQRDIDLNQNEIRNVVIENLPNAPENPKEGQFYYNTTDKTFYIFDGVKWITGKTYEFADGLTLVDSTVTLDKATKASIGGVVIGENIDVNDGVVSVKNSSNEQRGLIQIVTDSEFTVGTDEEKAVNTKQVVSAIGVLREETQQALDSKADVTAIPTKTSELVNDSGFLNTITSGDVTTALGYTPYNSTNPSGFQENVIETIKVNGTAQVPSMKSVDLTIGDSIITLRKNGVAVGSFSVNSTIPVNLDVTVPTTVTELTSSSQMSAINSGVNSTIVSQVGTNATNITDIQSLIPEAATSANQLADKSFVNSSIATNTAYFIGTFNSVAELEAYSGPLTNNDYAFVVTTDTAGNTLYDRYKYNGSQWLFEYELNNSSFTSDQWEAINSKATSVLVSQISVNKNEISTIKSTLSTFGNIVTHSVAEFATEAQGRLADSALQPGDSNTLLVNDAGYQANVIETVKVNGTALTPTSKAVDITVPTTITQLASTAQLAAIDSGVTDTLVTQITTNTSAISTINDKIPSSASTSNLLVTTADIATNIVTVQNGASITLSTNTIYNGSTLTGLTITLPSTIVRDFICELDFTSGTTATTITYPNTINWIGDDVDNNVFTPVANKRYTIMFIYNGEEVLAVVVGVV